MATILRAGPFRGLQVTKKLVSLLCPELRLFFFSPHRLSETYATLNNPLDRRVRSLRNSG